MCCYVKSTISLKGKGDKKDKSYEIGSMNFSVVILCNICCVFFHQQFIISEEKQARVVGEEAGRSTL